MGFATMLRDGAAAALAARAAPTPLPVLAPASPPSGPGPSIVDTFGANWQANAQAAQNSGGAPWLESGGWVLQPSYLTLGDFINGGGPTSQTLDSYDVWRRLPDGSGEIHYSYDPAGNFQRSWVSKDESLFEGAVTTIKEGGPMVAAFAVGANYLFPVGGAGAGAGAGAAGGTIVDSSGAGLSGFDLASDTPGWWGTGGAGAAAGVADTVASGAAPTAAAAVPASGLSWSSLAPAASLAGKVLGGAASGGGSRTPMTGGYMVPGTTSVPGTTPGMPTGGYGPGGAFYSPASYGGQLAGGIDGKTLLLGGAALLSVLLLLGH